MRPPTPPHGTYQWEAGTIFDSIVRQPSGNLRFRGLPYPPRGFVRAVVPALGPLRHGEWVVDLEVDGESQDAINEMERVIREELPDQDNPIVSRVLIGLSNGQELLINTTHPSGLDLDYHSNGEVSFSVRGRGYPKA